MTRQTMHGIGPRRIDEQLRLERLQREVNAPAAPPGGWVEANPVPLEVVHARVSASRVSPRALQVECAEHAAAPDVPCWGSPLSGVVGVCRGRLAKRAAVTS
ncbi:MULTISPECIES: hypothetical protein [unclassified Microbacterium]|uniref:hypothetical protein n=1 Tax=unclassified Microbacterium TaxID=2609290 RepID=UPI002469C07F|nr:MULTISPECIES: hypothetical protein [unclassified Microbacterium]MDH5134616.1 hypothetical protein [Microbacterium sp. RD10]MDH5138170.1 hypothetical protein [Microbacterium sp. RD11]MDH5146110.1 hypothetical protein [Microbacterium sp. RD12]MDH5156159.1 hypothetical protein [Microbacterium sp. RD06]MDH5168097.1 hypothetical protein [Microbacterium sp. RD02]